MRDAGANVVLRRAVLLHTDSVLAGADVVAASGGTTSWRAPVKMLVGDGNSAGMEGISVHWELARLAARSVTPDPRADPFVRDWYRATVAFGQSFESFDSAQLEHGLRLFPDDPQLLLLAGCEREAFASSLFQVFARSMISKFLRVPFGSAGGELEAAERYLPASARVRSRVGRGATYGSAASSRVGTGTPKRRPSCSMPWMAVSIPRWSISRCSSSRRRARRSDSSTRLVRRIVAQQT